jgi:hypothetical protein
MRKPPSNFKDLSGQRFGKLLVLNRQGDTYPPYWNCQCDCGTIKAIAGRSLSYGASTSCGCVKSAKLRAQSTIHGLSNSPGYKNWQAMIQRCTDPNHVSYAKYGARGITVCDEWKTFAGFAKDMLPKPFGNASLDRIDNATVYSKATCKWSTPEEQSNNKTNNIIATLDGETKPLAEWAKIYGIPYGTLRHRIQAKGMPLKDALKMKRYSHT